MSPALQHFLDQFGTRPAFVPGRRWDILAWNDAGCAIFGDYRRLTAPRERNTIWGIFTNPLAKKAKGLAQSLAAHGLEVGVRQWVSTGPGQRTKTRGVRGLRVQDGSQIAKTDGDRWS